MPIQTKNTNILTTDADILVHQVNGLGVMGAGLAKQIAHKYPHVERAYKRFVHEHGGTPETLLGQHQFVATDDFTVANVFGQARIGRDRRQTNYNALEKGLERVAHTARSNELSVAIPYGIGCGLAGGEWQVVSSIIEKVFVDVDVTLYKFTPGASR